MQTPPQNLLLLLVPCNYDLSKVPAAHIIHVLEFYTDPFDITQENMFYLINSGETTEAIWRGLIRSPETLSFSQLLVFFKSMDTMHFYFAKRFSLLKRTVPEEIIDKMLDKALKMVSEADLEGLGHMISVVRNLNPGIVTQKTHLLQSEFMKMVEKGKTVSDEMLKMILANLPKGFYFEDKEMVEGMALEMEKMMNKIWIGEVISALVGLHRSGYPLKFKTITQLTEINLEFLKSLNYGVILELLNTFIEAQMLTQEFAADFLLALESISGKDLTFTIRLIELVYKIKKQGNLNFVLQESNPLLRMTDDIQYLSESSLLKYSSVILSHTNNKKICLAVEERLSKKLNTSPSGFNDCLDLVLEVQGDLIEAIKEVPIFSYQILSYASEENENKIKVSQLLHEYLQSYQPAHTLVFKFLAETNENRKVHIKDFEVAVDSENVLPICKCLWRYQPEARAYDRAVEFLESNENDSDYTEALYYLLASGVKVKVDMKNIKKNSSFYLPLCFELGILPQDDTSVSAGLLKGQLFGEPLLKALILCLEQKIFLNSATKISEFLSFYPQTHPKLSIDLLSRLIPLLPSSSLNLYSTAILFSTHLSSLSPAESKLIRSFFTQLAEKDSTLKKLLQNHMPTSIGLPKSYIKTITQPNSNPSSLLEDLKIVQELTRMNRVSNKFLSSVFQSLQDTQEKSQILIGVSVLIKHMLVVGSNENIFEYTFELIDKNSLWNSLSPEDLQSMHLLKRYLTHKLPENSPEVLKNGKFLHKLENEDEIIDVGNLKCYKAFKYETKYEARFVVSNRINSNMKLPDFIKENELDELFHNLKKLFLAKSFLVNQDEEVVQYLNSYFFGLSKREKLKNAEKEIKKIVAESLKIEGRDTELNISKFSLKGVLSAIVPFKNTKNAVLLLGKECFLKDEHGHIVGLCFLMKTFVEYLEKVTDLKLLPIDYMRMANGQSVGINNLLSHLRKPNRFKT